MQFDSGVVRELSTRVFRLVIELLQIVLSIDAALLKAVWIASLCNRTGAFWWKVFN